MATTYTSSTIKIESASESESLKVLREEIEQDIDFVTEVVPDGMIYTLEGSSKRIPRYLFIDGEWYSVVRDEPFKRK